MGDDLRIGVFLSGVSSEFQQARSLVADDLRKKELEVRVQESFTQGNDPSLLDRLHTYVTGCDTVVGLLGTRSGEIPPRTASERYDDSRPGDFEEFSYTQWEIVFALQHDKRLFLFEASEKYERDRPETGSEDRPGLQADFVTWLFQMGRNRAPFANQDELRRLVLYEEWSPATASGDRRTVESTEHGADAKETPRPRIMPRVKVQPRFLKKPPVLIGRRKELSDLALLLDDSDFIQIVGPPGVGKKTLLAQVKRNKTIQPDPTDRNLIDLLQGSWEELYESDKQGYVPSLNIEAELQDYDGLVLAADIDDFGGEILDLREEMPEASFLTTSCEVLDPSADRIELANLTDPKEMFELFEQRYRRVVPDQLHQPITQMCVDLLGDPALIVQLALSAFTAQTLQEWVTNRGSLRPEALRASLTTDPGSRKATEASAAAGDHVPRAVLTMLTSVEVVDAAIANGEFIEGSPRYLTNPVLDTAHNEPLLGEIFVKSLVWCKTAGATEICNNRAFVLRMMEWGIANERWAGVLEMGKATETAMALGGRHGAWEQVLQNSGLAAEKIGDRHAQGWVLHQLGSRALLRDDLGDARTLLRRARPSRRSGRELALTRGNLRLIPGAAISLVAIVVWLLLGLSWVGAVKAATDIETGPEIETEGPPIADLSPDLATFESVGEGIPITLVNLGTAPLEVAQLDDVDAFRVISEDDGCSGTTVAAGADCTFIVEFVGDDSDESGTVYAELLNVPLSPANVQGDTGVLLVAGS
jgi:hypothetical protein